MWYVTLTEWSGHIALLGAMRCDFAACVLVLTSDWYDVVGGFGGVCESCGLCAGPWQCGLLYVLRSLNLLFRVKGRCRYAVLKTNIRKEVAHQ